MADEPNNNEQGRLRAESSPLGNEIARELGTAGYKPTAPPQTPITPQVDPNAGTNLQRLRTFKGDLEEIVKTEHVSTVSVAAAEENRRAREVVEEETTENKVEQRERRTRVATIAISLMLVTLGLATGIYLYFLSQQKPTVAEQFNVTPLIFVEQELEIPVDRIAGRNLGDTLRQKRDTLTLRLGNIAGFYFTTGVAENKKLVDAQSFLKLLGISAPSQLTRTITPEFMLGVHVFDGNQGFLILQTDQYEGAFAGMLTFERSIMDDFYSFFGTPVRAHLGEGTTTAAFNPVFKDKIIKNHDTRVLYDESGAMRLLYSFVDRGMLVITTNENTFAEILTRLQSKRI